MSYFPEQTIRYITYIKNSMVEALNNVFQNHPDEMLSRTKATIEYPKTQAEFPSVVIRFFERDISNGGIGHEEMARSEGETMPSDEVTATVDGNQTIRITWPQIKGAIGYRVYRGTGSGLQNEYHETKSASLIDDGRLVWAKDVNLPEINTTDLEPPEPSAIQSEYGFSVLPAGSYYYKITALKPGGVWKYQHYFYTGDVEFAVYALSSYDRDLIRDTIVQTITMGRLEGWTNNFLDRIYPDPDTGAYPDSFLHFIGPNTDTLQGFGETQQQVQWGDEDNLLYMASYRMGVMGEFYSLPPNIPYDFVRDVLAYPWILHVEDEPQGDPTNDNEWQSFS